MSAVIRPAPALTLQDYWQGREVAFAQELTPAIRRNAEDLLQRVNRLLALMTTVDFERHPRTGSLVTSGWRPAAVNAATPGAAPRSLHMSGQAVDLYDPDGDLDDWCMAHQHLLARLDIDLYLEHPSQTKGWCHLQSAPPKSQARFDVSVRRRWFYA